MGPWNNIPSSTLVQRNNIVIWIDIPLFTSPSKRVIVCIRYGIAHVQNRHRQNRHSKSLYCKKTHGFVVYNVTPE